MLCSCRSVPFGMRSESETDCEHARSASKERLQDIQKFKALYHLICSISNDGILGDFVDFGCGDGEIAVFAAGLLKQFQLDRFIWICAEENGHTTTVDSHYTVEKINQMFRSYGLSSQNLRQIETCADLSRSSE